MNPFLLSFIEAGVAKLLLLIGPGLAAAGIVIPDIGHTANLVADALVSVLGFWWSMLAHNRAINLGVEASPRTPTTISGKAAIPAALTVLLLSLVAAPLTGCAGVTWPTIETDAVTALAALQKTAAEAKQSGAVPAGKTTDAVNDTGTIANALGKLATGQPVTQSDASALAASLHADGKTTDYIEIGSQVITGFVELTKFLIAQGQTTQQVQTAQTQYLVNATPAVQAGLATATPALIPAPPLANP